jgi:hypothetical protein
MKILIISFLVIAFYYSHAQSSNSSQPLVYDTSKIAIITYHYDIPWINDHDIDSAGDLTQQDIFDVEKIFQQSVNNHNNKIPDSVKKSSHYYIDFKSNDYKRQYVSTINSKNEKIIYVCCFCMLRGWDWRKTLLVAEEGRCFFTVKIDLTTKKYFDFSLDLLQ